MKYDLIGSDYGFYRTMDNGSLDCSLDKHLELSKMYAY